MDRPPHGRIQSLIEMHGRIFKELLRANRKAIEQLKKAKKHASTAGEH